MKDNCATKENAIQASNELLKKKGVDISKMNIEVKNEGNNFMIIYTIKDTLSLGNGAEIVINKEDCKIISKKFYQ